LVDIYFKFMNKINFKIGNKMIGPDHPVLIVAEISCNHQQSLEMGRILKDLGPENNN